MLRELSIKNFAIIEDLSVSFSQGLTVLSGETGAGKSVIVQAVNTLLGSRADVDRIRSGAEAAELEALFEIDPDGPLIKRLDETGYTDGNELLIRRVISLRKNHRIFINGRMATLSTLCSITEGMASISGQHEHQKLLKESEHIFILDRFAGLSALAGQMKTAHAEILPVIRRAAEIEKQQKQKAERLELIAFEQKEIEDADITPEQEAELNCERIRLKNASMLYESIWKSINTLYDGDGAAAERLAAANKSVADAAETDPALIENAEALSDVLFRVEDIVASLRSRLEEIAFDDRRLEAVEERLDTINRLKRKYGGSVESMLTHLQNILIEKAGIEDMDQLMAAENLAVKKLGNRLSAIANELTKKRKKGADILCRRIEKELASLNMPETRFSVSFQQTCAGPDDHPALVVDGKKITPSGLERPVFMISPNAGEEMRPLSKIASGGELSRVILAIKAILSNTGPIETIIFDEVDSGIGGETAETVGEKLAALARHNQVICITHLAQIGKFADHHYNIVKQVENGRTKTAIIPLDWPGRVRETARMIGGASITDTTLAHAKEMLQVKKRLNSRIAKEAV